MSSHGDPVSEIQQPLEEAALHAITSGLRNGTLPGLSSISFPKVVHVGHSFGSQLSYGLARDYQDISDGLVLTGFSQNGSFVADFELGGNFIVANTVAALSSYPNGYFAAGDASGVQTNFFAPGAFDPNILDLAYKTGEPVTVGELLTLGANGVNSFQGPVLIITGGEYSRWPLRKGSFGCADDFRCRPRYTLLRR